MVMMMGDGKICYASGGTVSSQKRDAIWELEDKWRSSANNATSFNGALDVSVG